MSIIKKIKQRALNTFLYYANKHYIKKGFAPHWGTSWLEVIYKDYKNVDNKNLSQKLWAYKNGFESWRIDRFGLTKENIGDILSVRDYMWLYPMNNMYSRWIDDKLTLKYILQPFDEHLPRYYYHLISSRGARILKLMDCLPELGATWEDVVKLLEIKGALAVKPNASDSGVGFYKFECKDDRYYINQKEVGRKEVISQFKAFKDYIVTEYIIGHKEMRKLYDKSLNTIRVMVLNRDGDNPKIVDGFFRVGTDKSGVIDNISSGGSMFTHIDVEKGKYFDPYICVSKYKHEKCSKHPDTKELVEGDFPHWDLVRKRVLEIAAYMPQLEWIGFDVAITDEGFKIQEINSHQDVHYILDGLRDETKNYLWEKYKDKKKRFEKKSFIKRIFG